MGLVVVLEPDPQRLRLPYASSIVTHAAGTPAAIARSSICRAISVFVAKLTSSGNPAARQRSRSSVHAAREAGDDAGAVAALSPDVTLISPITGQFTFRASSICATCSTPLTEGITYTDQVAEGRTVAYFYVARIGTTRLCEAQRLRLNSARLISEITLYMRSLPAITSLMKRLGHELARRNGQTGLARLIPIAGGVMHPMAEAGESRILPRTAPR